LSPLRNIAPVMSLDLGDEPQVATALTTGSVPGGIRMTLLGTSQTAMPIDRNVGSAEKLDSILSTIGVFASSDLSRAATFSETNFWVQFNDLITGERALSTIGRFSLIRADVFTRTLFPLQVASTTGREFIPGALLLTRASSKSAAEVIIPQYSSEGR